ncbi:GTPase/DUF3482 domain-containing protein [Advenella mimigardefordensis]|uniref:Putative GTP-binding protein n=1 Tax=Advenella mimigardefordensis (strain DSM 17166 / LMG 22922 / DPN7) TaxID=1247726 RepID=W0PBP9_ADVMD|nr:GTPase/DUF3482 domain-containing protein [Advenella mimigardefordensis]AHG62473.1 putative GTP-binding protein [Advenella mimigardefordensis DPN7]
MSTTLALRLAVVGHTNTGKTSLLRTLTHDAGFGQVSDAPGTTRHVEGARLLLNGAAAVELYDTPGLEDGIGLLDYLDQLQSQTGSRHDGPESITRFLDTPESKRRFEQEARVLKKLIACDAGLYVIDVRDPVLAKHKDELAILARCGKPLVPVLNFINDTHARKQDWKDTLARLGLHVVIEFDTVAPAIDGEAQLYQKLALVLDTHATTLQALSEDVGVQRERRRNAAFALVADMLIDVAALRISSQTDNESVKSSIQLMQDKVRQRERAAIKALLTHYRFRPEDYPGQPLPLEGGRWNMDLFNPQALLDTGIHVGKGFAAGAMAGAAVDVFTAGLSLGTAALIGGVLGSVWQGTDKLGKRLYGRLQGFHEVTVEDSILRLLAIRAHQLIRALELRGHADMAPVQVAMEAAREELKDQPLPEQLHEARSRPEWSRLGDRFSSGSRRDVAVGQLGRALARIDQK